ncbi:hypothetical protein [Chitinibacter sp. GC72]|uniref:hypothetical protein n=1 Tax=Chitinibacter sp. GC72 TaxID=1526917 RepID=UPI0012F732B8|nr:hypothetical protein [Chitinibacter sp. GC72]
MSKQAPVQNISGLIRAVEIEESTKKRRRESLLALSETKKRKILPIISALSWICAVGLWGYYLSHQPNLHQEKKDLAQALEMAKNDIDAHREIDGKLPSQLSNPALAAIVQYQIEINQHDTQSYRLIARAGQSLIEWESATSLQEATR